MFNPDRMTQRPQAHGTQPQPDTQRRQAKTKPASTNQSQATPIFH